MCTEHFVVKCRGILFFLLPSFSGTAIVLLHFLKSTLVVAVSISIVLHDMVQQSAGETANTD